MNRPCTLALAAGAVLFGAWLTFGAPAPPIVDVTTYHNDLARTGQNLRETVLTPANVNTRQFGKQFAHPVDGFVYGQPLYLHGVAVPGKGVHNLVFAATEHDSVYAFDADSNAGENAAPLWHVSFIDPAQGTARNERQGPVPGSDIGSHDIRPEVGITGTPVIDQVRGTIYLVARTRRVTPLRRNYLQQFHALDVRTGRERPGSPVTIQASVPGTGADSRRHMVSFNALRENQRMGLLLLNGVVYVTWASLGDIEPFHGWVIGYDARTLRRVAVFNASPNGHASGMWECGAAPAATPSSAGYPGSLFVATGNGDYAPGKGDFGDSFLKLSPAPRVRVLDWYTPYNQDTLDKYDMDLGSGGLVLLPASVGSREPPHLIFGGDKIGSLYLVDRDHMGHLSTPAHPALQFFKGQYHGLYACPAYFHGAVYYGEQNEFLRMRRVAHGRLAAADASHSPNRFLYPGCTPSISANGAANGIVWAIEIGRGTRDSGSGALYAYDARNLAHELYNSRAQGSRDHLGQTVKFSVPTIANGKVYVGTAHELVVFGLRR